MYFVYGLYSPEYKKIYIGFTADPDRRLSYHNHPLNTGYTAKFRPWLQIYTEELPDKKTAIRRERQLKTARSRAFIKNFIPK